MKFIFYVIDSNQYVTIIAEPNSSIHLKKVKTHMVKMHHENS